MSRFGYEAPLSLPIPSVVRKVAAIHDFKGEQGLYLQARSDVLDRLCASYAAAIENGAMDPLMLIARFVFDFVGIRFFTDGNGRMSRLSTLSSIFKMRNLTLLQVFVGRRIFPGIHKMGRRCRAVVMMTALSDSCHGAIGAIGAIMARLARFWRDSRVAPSTSGSGWSSCRGACRRARRRCGRFLRRRRSRGAGC